MSTRLRLPETSVHIRLHVACKFLRERMALCLLTRVSLFGDSLRLQFRSKIPFAFESWFGYLAHWTHPSFFLAKLYYKDPNLSRGFVKILLNLKHKVQNQAIYHAGTNPIYQNRAGLLLASSISFAPPNGQGSLISLLVVSPTRPLRGRAGVPTPWPALAESKHKV